MSGAPDGAKRIIAQHMAGQEPQSLFGLAASVPRSYLQRTNDAWNSGLDMANRGAQALQGGDLSGAAGMVLGPLGAVTAPITGIFPDAGFVEQGGKQLAQNIGADPKLGAATGLGLLAAAQSLMPTPSPAMFIGPMARNADLAALKIAQEMHAAGETPAAIHKATGWFQGADAKWKSEISDRSSQLGFMPSEMSTLNTYPVGAVVRHPELYDNYPELRRIRVQPEDGAGGGMNHAENTLHLGTGASVKPAIDRATHVKSVALHELSHAIAKIEGFDPGATMSVAKQSMDKYRRNAGETEARNVQRRMDWTVDQRRAIAPWVSEDVPRDQQLLASSPDPSATQMMVPGSEAKKGLVTQSYKEIMPDGTERWVPGTLRVNPPKERFDPEMSPADVERYIQQNGEAPRNWPKGRIETASYKDHHPDGTSQWVPGILRAKRPPTQAAPEGITAYHGSHQGGNVGGMTDKPQASKTTLADVKAALEKSGARLTHTSTRDGVDKSHYLELPGEPLKREEIRISDHDLGSKSAGYGGERQGGQWKTKITIQPDLSLEDHLRAIQDESYRSDNHGFHGGYSYQEWLEDQ